MALLQNTGNDPQGQAVALPVSGQVYAFKGNINDGESKTTGWFVTSNWDSLGFVFNANKTGYYTIEYSNDENGALFVPMITVQYTEVNQRRKGAIDQDANWCRITYYNNSGETANLSMRVNQKTGLFQASLETLGAKGAATRLGQWVKSMLHIPDSNGEYGDVERTGNALNVNVINQSQEEQGIAKDETLRSGAVRVQIVDGNNTNRGTQANPIAVSPTNTDYAKDTKLDAILAKLIANPATEATLTALLNKLNGSVAVTMDNVPNGGSTAALQTALNTLIGAINAAQATNSTGSWSSIALLKGILQRPATGTTTSVTTTASSSVVLAANANRKGASIMSVNGNILVTLGATTTAAAMTVRLVTNGYYEVPFGYTGVISAMGAGTLSVTELT